MADREISELTAATTPLAGTELVHIDQGGNSRKVALTDVVAIATGAMLKATYDPNDDGVIAVAQGGTGGATASAARTNLGLGTMAVQNAATVAITGGSITGITDLTVADGGTGASTASGARTNLGLVIGADVQAYSANLAGFAATTVANVQNRVNHTGTQLAATISDFSTAADARVSAAIGSTVQAYNALLDSFSDLSLTAGDIVYATGAAAVSSLPIGGEGQVLAVSGGVPAWGTELVVGGLLAANDLSDVNDAATALSNLGGQPLSANLTAWSALATSAKQNASANLTTLAAVTPGSKGLAILADTTSDAVHNELARDWSGGVVANSPSLSVPDYIGRSWIDVGALGSDSDNAKAAIDQAISEASGGGKVLRFTNRNYLLTSSSQMSFFIPNNTIVEGLPNNFIDASTAPLDGGGATTERSIIRCEGSLDATTYALASNASRGAWGVTLGAGVAASMGLSRFDLLLISSDALFPSGSAYPTTAHAGEKRTVYRVDGDTIYFFEPLEDDYLTANNAKVQKVTPWIGKVLGLNVRGRGRFPDADTGRGDTGIRLLHAKDAEVSGNAVHDCAFMSYTLVSTFNCRVIGNASRKVYADNDAGTSNSGKPSYGIGYVDGNQSLIIRGNDIRGGNSGITHTESGVPGVDRDILIESNFIEGNGRSLSSNGIGAHTTGERITARGNIIKGFGNGLNASCKHFVSEFNQVRHLYSGGQGISITERLEYFRSTGDTFEGGQYGISLLAGDAQLSGTSGPIEIIIEGLRAFNQTNGGIHLTYDDTTDAKKGLWIRNSVIRNVAGHSITVSGSFTEGRIDNVDVDGSNAAFRSLNVSGVTDFQVRGVTYKGQLAPLLSGTRVSWSDIRNWGATALPTIASANQIDMRGSSAITLPMYQVTGAVNILTILGAAGYIGRRLGLSFAGAPTVFHNNNGAGGDNSIMFQSAANFTAVAGSYLELVSDGAKWRAVGF